MRIAGSCHCRNIAFTLLWEPDPAAIPARACGCSFCTRHGGIWTSRSDAVLRIGIADAARVNPYAFGTRTAEFHVCGTCGVVPVATSRIEGRLYAVVNVNVFEGVDPVLLQRSAASFDVETGATRLARRKRNWIGDVEFLPAVP